MFEMRAAPWGVGVWMACVTALAAEPGDAERERADAEVRVVPAPPRSPDAARLSLDLGEGARFELPLSMVARFEDVSQFRVDADDNQLGTSALDTQVRVGLRFNSGRLLSFGQFSAAYEHDLVTGAVYGRNELEGAFIPAARDYEHQLRRAEGRMSFGRWVHVAGGFTMSHFGLGLVANDGAHGWTPGSAMFNDPRGGDRVLRATLATGPHTGGSFFAAVNVDSVVDDDVLIDGDEAIQVSGAIVAGYRKPSWIGLYAAYRDLEAANGGFLDVLAVDLSGQWTLPLEDGQRIELAGELAVLVGSTDAAGPADITEQDILQVGAALRASYHAGAWGVVLDGFFGSGDGDINDGTQGGFKADPNYAMGFVLFRHLMAAQTGRSAVTSADPDLVGRAPRGIQRFANRGGPAQSLAVFPRAYVRPLDGVEVYGGPMLAFATGSQMDPFNSQLAGGVVRNAVDGDPGRYLGTEVDLGARWRLDGDFGVLDVGLEYGLLLPGDAYQDAAGTTPDPIHAGRAILGYRL